MILEVNINTNYTNFFIETEQSGIFCLQNEDRLYYDNDLDSITMIHYKRSDTWYWIKVIARDPRFISGLSKSRSDLSYLKMTGLLVDITKSVIRDSKLNSVLK